MENTRIIKGYASLSEQQKELFERVFSSHFNAMGTEMRKDHTADHITEVNWDQKENCLKVYFDNGNWWHYMTDGTWY